MTEIQKRLFAMQDAPFADFQARLIPTVERSRMIGVRTPALRALAKELKGSAAAERFMGSLPHEYFEENQLHGFLISLIKDYDQCLAALERFLPYVDNWATCDQLSPGCFKKRPAGLAEKAREWIESGETYTVRFGIGVLMSHYLDEGFDNVYPELVAGIRSEEYYVNMMIAWYFATALAKQYDAVIGYFEGQRLPLWAHNKAIQKALESYRVSAEHKAYLRSLKGKTDG